jgi:hypothetical protein
MSRRKATVALEKNTEAQRQLVARCAARKIEAFREKPPLASMPGLHHIALLLTPTRDVRFYSE